MLTNIVVPMDSSSYSWSAAQHAIQMAQSCRATIHGISVTDIKIIEGQLLDDLNIDSAKAQTLYQDKGRMLLEQLENKCQEAGVKFHPVQQLGTVAGSIIRTASEVKAELIVMGKKGTNSQWTSPLLGTIAESVVRQAKRPVMLTSELYSPIETVYVAYDGEFVSIRALRFTAELSVHCQWKMKVISVHSSQERRNKLLREAVEMAELHEQKISTIGKSGDVMQEILSSTSEEPSALIVLGAYSSRLRRLILGDIPEQIMRKAPQPVMLYRPLQS